MTPATPSFWTNLMDNLVLTIISSSILWISSFLIGLYGRRIIYHLKRGIYYAFNAKIKTNQFEMTIAHQTNDESTMDKLVSELKSKLKGRELKGGVFAASEVVLNVTSRGNVFDVCITKNENVVPELQDIVIDISVVIKLKNTHLHYRDAFSDLSSTLSEAKQYVHGVLGNDIDCAYRAVIPYSKAEKTLYGASKGVAVTIKGGEIAIEGDLGSVLDTMKQLILSTRLAIYRMIKV